jgi:hypothetical protein
VNERAVRRFEEPLDHFGTVPGDWQTIREPFGLGS